MLIGFVYKQTYCRYNIVPLSQQNNKEIRHNKRKRMSLIQKDRLNIQKNTPNCKNSGS